METGSTLKKPNIYLLSINEDGFSLKLNRTTGGKFKYSELKNQILKLQTKESYKIHTSEAPIYKLMAKLVKIPLDDFREF